MDITAIVVNHRTPDLIRKAVSSLRAFYSDLALIVIDNGSGDESTQYIRGLPDDDKNTRVILNDANLGHGPALHQGIVSSQMHYVFTMDSDCEVKRGGFLEMMLAEFARKNLYAVGDLCQVNNAGINVPRGIPYIHPFAAVYDREKYLTLPPFANHGAPAVANMMAAQGRYAVLAFDIKEYIEHAWMGTRRVVMTPAQLAIASRPYALVQVAMIPPRLTPGFANIAYTGGRQGTFGLVGFVSKTRYTIIGQQQPIVNDKGEIGVDPRDVERILSINRGGDFAMRDAAPGTLVAQVAPAVSVAPSAPIVKAIPQHPTDAPFMSFVTRACKRPGQLLRCLESVAQQTDQDYENVLIVDSVGVGVNAANEFFYQHRYRVRGEWVYMIDDDDVLIDPDFIAAIKSVVTNHQPDIIMVKARHPLGILPDALVWGKSPKGSHIGTPAYVVRRDIWREHIKEFGGHGYAGDFSFGVELFKHNYKVYWLDRVVCAVPTQHVGRPE